MYAHKAIDIPETDKLPLVFVRKSSLHSVSISK